MRGTILATCIAAALAAKASAQSVVILPDNAYASCSYMLENFEKDQKLRSFMIDYTFGFLSGLNASRQVSGQPVLDFAPIENPMLITWTVQVCREDPNQAIHQAWFRLFNLLLQQQGK